MPSFFAASACSVSALPRLIPRFPEFSCPIRRPFSGGKRIVLQVFAPVALALPAPGGGICCRGKCPKIFLPHPPDPLPRRGRGRFLVFFLQGASPPAPPCLRRRRRWRAGRLAASEGNCPGSLSLPRPGGRGPSQAPPSLQRRMVPSPPDPPTLLGCSLPGRERKLFGSKWVPSPVS